MTLSDSSRSKRGFTVFLTGLPAAGKTTIANELRVRLTEISGLPIHLLDADDVRKTFSSGLGFSREDRNENVRRMGEAAAEITESGDIAICAAIVPYDAARKNVRQMISATGGFCLVYISTPVSVCEARDPKGEYAQARAGILAHFTGVSDPYEPPEDAEVIIDTTDTSVRSATEIIVERLQAEGFIANLTPAKY
jgi:sulfate adenylyltransferase